MILFLKVLLYFLCVIFLLLLLMLIAKTFFSFRFSNTEKMSRFFLRVFFVGRLLGLTLVYDSGVIKVFLELLKKKIQIVSQSPKKKKSPVTKKSLGKVGKKKKSLFSIQEWIALGKEVLRRLFRVLHYEQFSADLIVGLGNPASTGLFIGTYCSIRNLFSALDHIDIKPTFVENTVRGEAELTGSVRLIQIFSIIFFVLKKLLIKMITKRRK